MSPTGDARKLMARCNCTKPGRHESPSSWKSLLLFSNNAWHHHSLNDDYIINCFSVSRGILWKALCNPMKDIADGCTNCGEGDSDIILKSHCHWEVAPCLGRVVGLMKSEKLSADFPKGHQNRQRCPIKSFFWNHRKIMEWKFKRNNEKSSVKPLIENQGKNPNFQQTMQNKDDNRRTRFLWWFF